MQRFFSPALAVALLLALSACGDSAPELRISERGYPYVLRHDEPGATLAAGDVAKFHMQVMKGDSVLMRSRDGGEEAQAYVLPDDPSVDQGPANILIDALRLMSVGDSLSVYLPMDTIPQRPPGFEATDSLRYDIVVVSKQDTATYMGEQRARNATMRARMEAYSGRGEAVADSTAAVLAQYKRGASGAGFTTTASGLKYKILESGTGPQPAAGQPVLVSYYGVLTRNGEMFDNSFRAGQPIDFPLGQGRVIAGWDEGIGLLREGARAVLAIPADLAYGDNPRPGGPIQAGDELMFYVQLEEVAQ